MRSVRRETLAVCLAALGLAALGYVLGSYRLGSSLTGPPPAWAQAAVPAGNGDLNADGAIDVSDAVHLLNYLFLAGAPPAPIRRDAAPATTVFVVRHGERETAGDDPCLTPEGSARALRLREVFSRQKIDAIFSTSYCRTTKTVEPLALALGLNIQTVERTGEVAKLLDLIRALRPGSAAVVAGNSFNIPALIEGLGAGDEVSVPGSQFDNIWVVHLGDPACLVPGLTRLRYE